MPDVATDLIPLEDAKPLSDNEIKSVVELARQQWQLEKDIERLQAELEEKKRELDAISLKELPQLMTELGIRGQTMSDGTELELKEEVYGTITGEKAPLAFKWLEDHEHGDLIKRQFTILFGRDDEAWAKKFTRDLAQRKRPLNSSVKRAVHPQTLNKWLREMIKEGKSFPEELFGVHRRKVAVLKPPKKVA